MAEMSEETEKTETAQGAAEENAFGQATEGQADRSVRASVALDATLQSEILHGVRIVYLVLLIAGFLSCAAYVAVDVCADEGKLAPSAWYSVLLWAGAVLFAVGLVCTVVLWRAVKRARDARVLVNRYTFYESGYFVVDTVCGEDTVALAKVKYSDCRKIRENRKFFLIYQTSANIFPVRKSDLSGEEVSALRSILGIPSKHSCN